MTHRIALVTGGAGGGSVPPPAALWRRTACGWPWPTSTSTARSPPWPNSKSGFVTGQTVNVNGGRFMI